MKSTCYIYFYTDLSYIEECFFNINVQHKNWEEQIWLWIPFFPHPFVAPSCLFEPQALWTVSAWRTDMMYGHSHSFSSVAMAFCLLTRWLGNFAMKVSTKDQKLSCGTVLPLPSVLHDAWQVLGRMDEKAIPCHAFTYFSSLADILSHLSSTWYLKKCREKKDELKNGREKAVILL